MKSADAVFMNSFPVTDGLLLTEMAQNGITAPIMGAQADNAIQAFKLAPASALANMYYPPYCDPDVNTTKQAKAFTSAYKAAYPSTTQSAVDDPATYDGVYLIAKAIQAARRQHVRTRPSSPSSRSSPTKGPAGPTRTTPRTS